MEEAKRMGLGGFDIWDVRSVVDEEDFVPAGPPFMSDPYVEAIVHAINEAERLELDLGVIIASGWNAGGAWTKPEHQTMAIYRSNVIFTEGPKQIAIDLPFPTLPDEMGTDYDRNASALIPKTDDGLPEYYKDVAVLAFPMAADSSILESSSIVDLSGQLSENGELTWDVPKGKWVITRYVCAATGQPMFAHTPNSRGPMIDHFNPDASEAHINYFIEKIEEKLGKPIGESGLTYFYTDSYEVRGQLWTPDMVEEFEKRMGYSILPFLPTLDGYGIDNEETTMRFEYDFAKIMSDLIIDNHYSKTRQICEEHGVGFVAEAAGPGQPIHNCPFESLKSSGSLTFPRGEFWHIPRHGEFWKRMRETRGEHYLNQLQVIKGVSSASHIYDQKYVEAEAFTGVHLWQESPAGLKEPGDRAFCEGLNRINFHTWPHTPPEAGVPGWVYAFGTLVHETRNWWPLAKPWMEYLGRCSYMLQSGYFKADVLYYYGDQAPNFVPPKHQNKDLGFGFDYDVTNTDILLNGLSVVDGKITLPHGPFYEVLVLPEQPDMQPVVLKKVMELVKAGAIVIGPKPERSPGYYEMKKNDDIVNSLGDELWGDCDGETVFENKYGKGKVIWGKEVKTVLEDINIGPDFDFVGNVENKQLDFIHRKMDGADAWFVRNTSDEPVSGDGLFRITGRKPEYWDPVTGSIVPVMVYTEAKDATRIPLTLDAYGSVFIVLVDEESEKHINSVNYDGEAVFPHPGNRAKAPFRQMLSKVGCLQLTASGNYSFIFTDGATMGIRNDLDKKTSLIDGPWKVTFPEERKGPGEIEMGALESWTRSNIDGVKFFSGIAVYEKTFEVSDIFNDDKLVYLNLGSVREIARITVNDKLVGTAWHAPFKLDITEVLKPGTNKMSIEVANTWANRMAGDAKLPKSERITSSNVVRLPNAWATPMKEIPAADTPLLESGLLGPVSLEIYFAPSIE